MIHTMRTWYRRFIHWPLLDRLVYAALDGLTNAYSALRRFSFPAGYTRRWKLDMLWGLYEKETYDLFQTVIKPDMVIIDIGAHIGYFTRRFAKLAGKTGRVLAFEADRENFELLKKNTSRLKNTRLFPLAISDHSGSIDFYN